MNLSLQLNPINWLQCQSVGVSVSCVKAIAIRKFRNFNKTVHTLKWESCLVVAHKILNIRVISSRMTATDAASTFRTLENDENKKENKWHHRKMYRAICFLSIPLSARSQLKPSRKKVTHTQNVYPSLSRMHSENWEKINYSEACIGDVFKYNTDLHHRVTWARVYACTTYVSKQ